MTENVNNFREARHLSKLFPERYRLYAKIVQTSNTFSKTLFWHLTELKELAPNEIIISKNYDSINGLIPLNSINFDPYDSHNLYIVSWIELTEKDLVSFIPDKV